MKIVVKVSFVLFVLSLLATVVLAIMLMLTKFAIINLVDSVERFVTSTTLAIAIVLSVLSVATFLITSTKVKCAEGVDDELANTIDESKLSPIELSYFKERTALLNIIDLMEKNGCDTESVDALVERLPAIKETLEEMIAIPGFTTPLTNPKQCLEKILASERLIGRTLMNSEISQDDFRSFILEATALIRDAAAEPIKDETSQTEADAAWTRFESDDANEVNTSELLSDSGKPSSSTPTNLISAKKLQYVSTFIPSCKEFNSKTQSNFGWGEAYGGISAQYRCNVSASPTQQEMLRRSSNQTSQQIIIQTADPQVRKPEKSKAKLIAIIAGGVVLLGIIAYVIYAMVSTNAALN